MKTLGRLPDHTEKRKRGRPRKDADTRIDDEHSYLSDGRVFCNSAMTVLGRPGDPAAYYCPLCQRRIAA